MFEQDAWNKITTYLAENNINKALESKLRQKLVIGTIKNDVIETIGNKPNEIMGTSQKHDCIIDVSAQVVSGCMISKWRLQESIKIKDKLVPTRCRST